MNLSPEIQGFLGACAGLLIVIECVLVSEWLKAQKANAEASAWIEAYFAAVRTDKAKRDQWGRFIPQYRRTS